LKQLTVRGVSVELHRAVKEEARRRGLSINRYVLYILHDAVGMGDEHRHADVEFHDMDHLAGTWSPQEYEEFERHLTMQRGLDEDLWH
jgi:hypothetical protein